jgi:hypothetical protein
MSRGSRPRLPTSCARTIIARVDELSNETKREIVRLIFPDLRYGGDPDVERYFELRKDGRMAQALAIYNGALRVRYPVDAARVLLLKLYRERDPRYSSYQEELLFGFAERLSLRIRHNIDLVTAPLEKADLSDALRALKAVESVLARIPGDTDGALALLSRYAEFARVLGYREKLVRRALELVREYDAVSRADSPADYDFIARSEAIEEKRRASSRSSSAGGASGEGNYDFVSRSAEFEKKRKSAEKAAPSYFDPERIKFSAADRALVEISPDLVRREDKVLAFCAKYWPYAADSAFERTVFLYSRKYGGKNFEIFRAIKIGRGRRATDDEILSAVSGILTTSYNYSVSGDLYMQIMWRRLRGRMEARAVAERLAEPGPEATTRSKAESVPESRVRKAQAARAAEAEAAPTIPPPPAGDVEPTRLGRRGELARGFSAPPSFALKEASARATSRPSSAAPARSLDLRSRFEPAASASRFEEDRPLALRAARRAAGVPTSRTQAPAKAAAPLKPVAAPVVPAKPVAPIAPAREAAAPRKAAAASAPAKPARPSSVPAASPVKAVAPSAPAKARKPGYTAEPPALRPTARVKGARLLGRSPSGPEPVREIRGKGGSISDSIRKLSGRGYDVYREIFLEKVRDHIRRALLSNQTRGHGLFDTAANEAEDQVYGFISAHYDDPFMDWEHSAEREAVEALGFTLPSLGPIIESCFRKL